MNALLITTLALVQAGSLAHESVPVDRSVAGLFEAKGAYPRFLGPSPIGRAATEVLKGVATREAEAFAKVARVEAPELRRLNSAAQYAYQQGFTVHTATPDLISVEMATWLFTGGAHGNSTTTSYTWSRDSRGRIQRVTLADLLRKNVNAKHALSPEILGEILRSDRPNFVDDGSVHEVTNTQLERFVVTRRGLLWTFDPYEVGPYSSGPFTVELPVARLKPWLRPGNPAESVWKR